MEYVPLDIKEARRILTEKKVAAPLDEDYLLAIVTVVLVAREKPGQTAVEVKLRPDNYNRMNSAPTTACLAIEALMEELRAEGKRVYLVFREDGRTVEVRFYPESKTR